MSRFVFDDERLWRFAREVAKIAQLQSDRTPDQIADDVSMIGTVIGVERTTS